MNEAIKNLVERRSMAVQKLEISDRLRKGKTQPFE